MPASVPTPLPRRSLLARLFFTNAAVLLVATAVLVASPITVSSPVNPAEGAVIFAGLVAMLGLDFLLLREALGPIRRLRGAMTAVDPLAPGQRLAVGARTSDVAVLERSFNEMLERLEAERRDSARRAQAATEAERRRVALELHDEVGQNLTALLLQVDLAARADDGQRQAVLGEVRETARASLDHIRAIVRRLRPEALDELGLRSALLNLCDRVTRDTGLAVSPRFADDLPPLSADAQLVVFRVAQEGLTNVVRHAAASAARVELDAAGGGVRLTVSDDGTVAAPLVEGSGVRGMRERALLIGALLTVEPRASGGLQVALDVPAAEVGR